MPIPIPPKSRLIIYGLTEDDFVALWEAQHGACNICERRFTKLRPANIDHCHKTHEVRGLLCGNCNLQIGWMHDDYGWFRNAAEHLNAPPADKVFDTPRRMKGAPPVQEDNNDE